MLRIPYGLLKLLPLWDHICPKCKKEVKKSSRTCPHCHEHFDFPLRIPPKMLKDKKALGKYVHEKIFPRVSAQQREYLTRFFTVIFSDGEVGSRQETAHDLSAWDGTFSSGTGTSPPAVVVGDAYEGEDSFQFIIDETDYSAQSSAYKNIAGYNPVYTGFFAKLDHLPVNEGATIWLQAYTHYASMQGNFFAALQIRKSGGNIQLGYQIEGGNSHFENISIAPGELHYFNFGVYEDATNGWLKVYYDGNLIINDVANTVSDHFPIRSAVGAAQNSRPCGATFKVNIDSVVVADVEPGTPAQEFELEITATAGGTTNPIPGIYTINGGQTQQVTAIPDAAYNFDHWELDGLNYGSTNPASIMMNANHALLAVFTTGETPFFTKEFSDGTINPMGFFASGGNNDGKYEVLTPAQDPLGQGIACCKLTTPTGSGGARSCLTHDSSNSLKTSRVVIDWMTPVLIPTTWVGGISMRQDMAGTLAEIQVYNSQWRVDYEDNGSQRVYFGSVLPMVKYRIDLRIKIGNGDGSIEVYINGALAWSKGSLHNSTLGAINHIECGTLWGDNNFSFYIYSVEWYGEIANFITVTGKTVDSLGNPIEGVGIRLGAEPPASNPSLTGTYIGNVHTDATGIFSFQALPGSYGELKLIKLGYGDPSYKVGSITKIYGIDMPDGITTFDFGTVILQNRPSIQPSALAQGQFWPIRSITIWPYTYAYSSAGYRALLRELKSKDLRFSHIDIRWGLGATDPPMSNAEARAAIQTAHEEGFKVLLTLVFADIPSADSGDLATVKGLALSRLDAVKDLEPDAINLGWETWVPDNGSRNADWQNILDAVRAASASWNPMIGYAASFMSSPSDVYNNPWFKNLDFLIILQWVRLSPAIEGQTNFFDPTLLEILSGYSIGHAWWEGPPVNLPQYYTDIGNWMGAGKVVVNYGGARADGEVWKPVGGYAETSVQDDEERATAYQAFFVAMAVADIAGCALEHFSFVGPAYFATGCFRNTLGEDFIKEGLIAHSISSIPSSIVLTVASDANGTVSPIGNLDLTIGETYQFQATANAGYVLDHWNLNGQSKGSSNPLTLTITADMDGKTLTALFTQTPATPVILNIAVEGNGTTDLTPGSHEFNIGDTITIEAIPAIGNIFKQWTLSGTKYSEENPLSLLIDATMDGKTLTAEFTTTPIQPSAQHTLLWQLAHNFSMASAIWPWPLIEKYDQRMMELRSGAK